jgi:serine/threonine protein kinase
MAPENWSQDDKIYKEFYCQKSSDIYSLGLVFWELADGRGNLPWGEADIFQIREYVIKEKLRPNIPPETPLDFANLIQHCWRDSPLHRPGAAEVFLKVKAIANKVCLL